MNSRGLTCLLRVLEFLIFLLFALGAAAYVLWLLHYPGV
jgi:hypothetical protein